MSTASPPVRRRLAGGALRRYREDLGWVLDDAAKILDCDRSKISRIETGHRGIRPGELRRLLAGYGAGEQAQDTLAAIAHPRGTRGWWQAWTDILPPAAQDFLALEAAATFILAVETNRVPDLLQTPDYARALAAADPALASDPARDRAAAAVLARQHAILTGQRAALTAVITETALRQPIGGPTVMRAQLAALARAGDGPGQVTVCVLPATQAARAAVTGAMTILRFAQPPGLAVVHLPGPGGGHCLDDPAALDAYTRAFARLRAHALSPAATTARLRDLAAA